MNKAEGQRLKQVLEWEHVTQQEFSAICELPQGTISRYINGSREIPRAVMQILRNKYGISLDWLLFGSGAAYVGAMPTKKDITDELMQIRTALSAIETKTAETGPALKKIVSKSD